MRKLFLSVIVLLLLPASGVLAGDGDLAVYFTANPLQDGRVLLDGGALDRLSWERDAPAFPGDRPGSLTALYDATLEAGRVGLPLSVPFTQDDPFTAAALLIIEPDGFIADPNGFFQISWGLWSDIHTGMQRTGTLEDFATDTFELVEFAYFPNESFFGGPFVTPTVFGIARDDLPVLDAFTNFSFASVERELPRGRPLLTVLEHRPADHVLRAAVFEVVNGNKLRALEGASAAAPLDLLAERIYTLDRIGLTLWQDGFTGPEPSVRAEIHVHGLIALPRIVNAPEELLHVPPSR